MTNLFEQLSQDLTKLIGINVSNTEYSVECKENLSSEQYAIFERICDKAGLRVVVENHTGFIIADVADQQRAINTINNIAKTEEERIHRLETSQPLLEKKIGVKFKFDDMHKILISEDILPADTPTNDSRKKVIDIYELHDKKLIEYEGRLDNNYSSRIMVFDASPQKLTLLKDHVPQKPLGYTDDTNPYSFRS